MQKKKITNKVIDLADLLGLGKDQKLVIDTSRIIIKGMIPASQISISTSIWPSTDFKDYLFSPVRKKIAKKKGWNKSPAEDKTKAGYL